MGKPIEADPDVPRHAEQHAGQTYSRERRFDRHAVPRSSHAKGDQGPIGGILRSGICDIGSPESQNERLYHGYDFGAEKV